jgi:hypothetical protein
LEKLPEHARAARRAVKLERLRRGRRARGVLALGGTALVASALFAGPASAQSPNAADHVPIFSTNTFGCGAGGPSVPPGSPIVGSVNVRSDGNGPVVAEVSLKDGRPNTTYQFLLLQTPGERGCIKPANGTSTTNGQGNGNVRLSVAKLPDTTGAYVISFNTRDNLVSGHYMFGNK